VNPPEEQAVFEFGPPQPRVRIARPQDRPAIHDAIGRAFFDDPVAMHLFPDESTRRRRFGSFARLAIDSFVGHGAIHTTDPVRGAAIWQAPSPPRLGFWTQLRFGLGVAAATRRRVGRAIELGQTMRRHHLREPHWYLAILGTVPEAQGRGIGSAMIRPILDLCDEQRRPAYLESSKESNIPFYQRQGFEVVDEIRIEDGPTLWPMRRRPAGPSGP